MLLGTVERSPAADISELDVLRDVLTGVAGTPAQRNTLLRIIRQNQKSLARGRVIDKLCSHVGDTAPNSQSLFAKYSDQRPTDPVILEALPSDAIDTSDDDDDDYEDLYEDNPH